ncbi:MAG: aldehyde dehydrogenase family protein [Calditrichaeota bacterium]|nr:aldehyde dehydrogenase family protein [Calditrichota bacterium]
MAISSFTADEQIQKLFALQRAYRWRLARSDARSRIEKLKRIQKAVESRVSEIQAAIYQDLRRHPVETKTIEIFPLLKDLRYTIRHLRHWMKPRRVPTLLPFLGARSYIQYEPRGQVLIMAPWNYPFQLAISPLVGAIAAGNTVILKPSEISPHTAEFLKQFIEDLFPPEEVAVVTGGADVAQSLIQLPFDHIFFTGSTAKGKLVMEAAARNLASVTLELGGKSPVIIAPDASIQMASQRIAFGKFINAGQTCIAPDYVLVPANQEAELVAALKQAIERMYGPIEEMASNPDFARLIHDGHWERLMALLDEAREKGATVYFGGQGDAASRFLAPTVVGNLPAEVTLLQEEIFGPILPIVTYQTLDEAIAFIRERPKPLALYIFSHHRPTIRRIMKETSSGSVVVNETLTQYGNITLPFGGVNHSGIGSYHGFHGFRTFSHAKAVMVQSRLSFISIIYPPYTERVKKLVDLMVRLF